MATRKKASRAKAPARTSGFDFSNVSAMEVETESEASFILDDFDRPRSLCPVLVGVFGGAGNKNLRAAVNVENAKAGVAVDGGTLDAEGLADHSSDLIRKLFAGNVITQWSNVFDAAGVEVPFSVEACREFLEALPDWILVKVAVFFTNPKNFTRAALDPKAIRSKAKN